MLKVEYVKEVQYLCFPDHHGFFFFSDYEKKIHGRVVNVMRTWHNSGAYFSCMNVITNNSAVCTQQKRSKQGFSMK